jgi:hypothetical protein
MNRKNFEKKPEHINHNQRYKLSYVIRNTGTGAYLCDDKLNTRIFRTIGEAERERERLHLSDFSYETKIVVVRETTNMKHYI